MDLLSLKSVKELIENTDQACLSIYQSTFVSGKDFEQNQIRFKNLVRKGEEQLYAKGLCQSEVDKFLKPVKAFLDDSMFWKHQSHGLAVFRSHNSFQSYRLPLEFKELSVVSGRFHIKPLLPFLSSDGRYYILAFSKGKIRLLEGTKYSVTDLELKGVTKNLAEALKFDVYQKELQYNTGAPRHQGKRDAIFFGGGSNQPDAKEEILRYFQQVDKGIKEFLKDDNVPLVLAGVDYLIPIYKEANKYPHLVSEGIAGNPDILSVKELHDKTWQLVAPVFYENVSKAFDRLKQLHGSESKLTSISMEEIVPAAISKRIELLFVSEGVQIWGAFNQKTQTVEIHESWQNGDEDLLDFVAVHTLLNGGTVFSMPLKKMLRQKPAAAILRY